MVRLTMVLVASLCCLSTAAAAFVPPRDSPGIGKTIPAHLVKSESAEDGGGLVINDATEVQLDGRTCKYADVPKDAQIILLDIGRDKKLIRRIHFRTKK